MRIVQNKLYEGKTLCSSPTDRFQSPPAASSATNLLTDLARFARMPIPPASATAFATLEFTDKFAMAYMKYQSQLILILAHHK